MRARNSRGRHPPGTPRRERKAGGRHARAAHPPCRLPARAPAPHGDPPRLRTRDLRRVHGAHRRCPGAVVHRVRGRLRRGGRAHHRGVRRRCAHERASPRLHPPARPPVRVLHARNARQRLGHREPSAGRRRVADPPRACRQPLPLHRIPGHRGGGRRRPGRLRPPRTGPPLRAASPGGGPDGAPSPGAGQDPFRARAARPRRGNGGGGASGRTLPRSDGVADASAISWRTEVSASPETLWATLRDVPRMVAALPGAELAGPPEERPLRLRLTAAIGPMRASFAGEADVTFDDDARSGQIEGRAHDPASRSTSEGRVRFQVTGTPAGAAELELAIRYRIRGPLAQFSRGPVVDAVIEQLLARFAENLGAAAAGEAISQAPPPGGVRLLLAGLGSAIRRWFTR